MSSRVQRDRRVRREGAALVEGLVVSLVILTFFAGTWFFHDLMAEKGRVLRMARHEAWAATRFPCGEPARTGQETRNVNVPSPLRSTGTSSMSVEARTSMACNVEPRPGDTVVDAVLSTIDIGSLF